MKRRSFLIAALSVFLTLTFAVNAQDAGRLYRILVKGKYGFIDKTGKVIVHPRYQDTGEFSEGLVLVRKGLIFGYIDRSGRVVIKPVFWSARDFSEGLAAVDMPVKPNKAVKGFIDKTGKMVIDLGSDDRLYVGSFSEGLAVYYRETPSGYKAGFIDKTGKVAIELKFDAAFDFSDGMAQVRVGDKYGYIDKSGKMVIEPQFPQPVVETHPGGVLNKSDHSAPFREGLAIIWTGDWRWSVIDKTGKIILISDVNRIPRGRFSEGLIRFQGTYDEGFLNTDGSVAIKPVWQVADDFYEGLARVYTSRDCPDGLNQCWGYIDKTGTVIIKPQFLNADEFKGGLAWTSRRIDRPNRPALLRVGYIDRTGNFVWSVTSE